LKVAFTSATASTVLPLLIALIASVYVGVESFSVSGVIYLNGLILQSSGTVTFNNATIYVNDNTVPLNASCVEGNNSTIVVQVDATVTSRLLSLTRFCSLTEQKRLICSTMRQHARARSMS
jgi:hypothetical protein